MDKQGLLLCSRYSVAPNFFGYCGPDKNKSLIDHLKENVADKEVLHILKEFETLYPYLQLIAYANKITNPFDRRVVEAYWLGNSLLKNVSVIYPSFLTEKLSLDKKINNKKMKGILKKVFSLPVLPHHSFHVFNIFKRTGKINVEHTLETMDQCRISCGQIIDPVIAILLAIPLVHEYPTLSFYIGTFFVFVGILLAEGRIHWHPIHRLRNVKSQMANVPTSPKGFDGQGKSQNHILKLKSIIIKSKPLMIIGKKLILGQKLTTREVKIDYKGKSFIKDLKVGDWVSFHWGMVCDKLTLGQVKNLEHYTNEAISYYNL